MVIEQAQTSTVQAAHEHSRVESGLILHTQRLSTEDGPGIRTTVFFKGCPLNCEWCHNPESISTRPQIHWLETRCIGCFICIKTCPHRALSKTSGGIKRDRSFCRACGLCAGECPSRAMEMLGRTVSVNELVLELLKDKVYYANSGGGITLSGGEPLMQPDFATCILHAMKDAGVHTAVDTCGLCSKQSLDKVLPHVDMILFDLKETDPDKHRQYTGQDNRVILDNLHYIRDYVAAHAGRQLWIRTPLIPGATGSDDAVRRVGAFIHADLEDAVQRWELCSFNNLCRDKYRRLGLEWQYKDIPLLSKAEQAALEQAAKGSGVNPDIVFVTGAAKVES
jgi:pyruvate formate lyase activating enzyme